MTLKKLSFAIALGAVSSIASANSGTVEWTTDVPTVCGITIDKGNGTIFFQDQAPGQPTVFTLKSNANIQGNQKGAKLSVTVQSRSDNLADIQDADTFITVLSPSVEERKSIDQWNGNASTFIPSGRYDSYLEIMKNYQEIEGGHASMTTLLTVNCS